MASGIALHPPASTDAPAILDAVQESVAQLGPWMEWCTPGYGIQDAEAWVSSSAQDRSSGSAFEFVIHAGDGRLLGCCGLNQIDSVNRRANLGYWVRTSETGRGVATAAVRILVDWGFRHTDLERLEIMAGFGNVRSQRVATAVGAVREGVLRSRLLVHGEFHDVVMHSIVRSSWTSA